MKILENNLRPVLARWDDPGDYPNNAASSPLPSYWFLIQIDGYVLAKIEETDTIELPITVPTIQSYLDDNPGEIEHGVFDVKVLKWGVKSVNKDNVVFIIISEFIGNDHIDIS